MTPDERDAIEEAGREAVAGWPPLTEDEVERLSILVTPPAEPNSKSA
jgi:hypothetical protein